MEAKRATVTSGDAMATAGLVTGIIGTAVWGVPILIAITILLGVMVCSIAVGS